MPGPCRQREETDTTPHGDFHGLPRTLRTLVAHDEHLAHVNDALPVMLLNLSLPRRALRFALCADRNKQFEKSVATYFGACGLPATIYDFMADYVVTPFFDNRPELHTARELPAAIECMRG